MWTTPAWGTTAARPRMGCAQEAAGMPSPQRTTCVRWSRGTVGSCQGHCPRPRRLGAHGGVARRAGASPRPGRHASCGAAAVAMPCRRVPHASRPDVDKDVLRGRGACRRVGTCLVPGGPRRGRRQAVSRLAAVGQVGRAPGGRAGDGCRAARLPVGPREILIYMASRTVIDGRTPSRRTASARTGSKEPCVRCPRRACPRLDAQQVL